MASESIRSIDHQYRKSKYTSESSSGSTSQSRPESNALTRARARLLAWPQKEESADSARGLGGDLIMYKTLSNAWIYDKIIRLRISRIFRFESPENCCHPLLNNTADFGMEETEIELLFPPSDYPQTFSKYSDAMPWTHIIHILDQSLWSPVLVLRINSPQCEDRLVYPTIRHADANNGTFAHCMWIKTIYFQPHYAVKMKYILQCYSTISVQCSSGSRVG